MAFKLRSGNSALPFKQMGSTATQVPLQPPTPPQPAAAPFAKTYREAYDAQSAEKKSGQTFEQFETAAKAWNTEKYGTTEPTKEAAKTGVDKEQVARRNTAKKESYAEAGKETSYNVVGSLTAAEKQASKDFDKQSDAKEKEKQGEKAALTEKRKGQTKGQAKRDVKKTEEYKSTRGTGKTGRQERQNMRDEADAMSGGSRTERKDTKRQAKDMKDIGKLVGDSQFRPRSSKRETKDDIAYYRGAAASVKRNAKTESKKEHKDTKQEHKDTKRETKDIVAYYKGAAASVKRNGKSEERVRNQNQRG
jgi:hypothetical protein